MNPNNYCTLEQAKKLKELHFSQDGTDCVWVYWASGGFKSIQLRDNLKIEEDRVWFQGSWIKWCAAPNAQETSQPLLSLLLF